MSRALITESYLTGIANAIRAKLGVQDTYTPPQMAAAIESIPSGGITPTGTKNITQNGTHDVTQYASANVNVPNSYAAGDEGKVVSNGALVAQTSRNITANGAYDTTTNDEVVVSVQPNLQSKTTTENGTVTPDQGYDGLSSVVVNVSGGGDVAWNEPIVRNWDFSNPVNTRGQSSYSGNYILTINGWSIAPGARVDIVTGGIKLVKTSADVSFYYNLALDDSYLQNKALTASLLVDNVLYSSPVTLTAGTGRKLTLTAGDLTVWIDRASSVYGIGISHDGSANNALIQGIKLEFGNTQTLARTENNLYVLTKHQNIDEEKWFIYRLSGNN